MVGIAGAYLDDSRENARLLIMREGGWDCKFENRRRQGRFEAAGSPKKMSVKTYRGMGISVCFALSLFCCFYALGQEDQLEPLSPNDPRLSFDFPIQKGGKPFHFKIEIDKAGNITALSVFRPGDLVPLQELTSCNALGDGPQAVTANFAPLPTLLKHADINFDGFEDLELLVAYIPHPTTIQDYCFYLWNPKLGKFQYSHELTDTLGDPLVDPKNKTISATQYWETGATFINSTYRWNHDKLEVIERESLLGNANPQTAKQCAFEHTCERLVHGKLVTTLDQPVCTENESSNLPACPAEAPPSQEHCPSM